MNARARVQAARATRTGQLLIAAAAGGLAIAAAPAAWAQGDSGSRSASVAPTTIGNPAAGQPAATPNAPLGPSTGTHVYLKTTAGTAGSYVTADFPLPAGLTTQRAQLAFTDDGGVGEDVSAETAALGACVLSGTVTSTAPNDPVAYDCSHPVKGTRLATANGGSWTFDLTPLAGAPAGSGRLGVAIVPLPTAQTDASVVSVPRTTLLLGYTGTFGPIGTASAGVTPTSTLASPPPDPQAHIAGLPPGTEHAPVTAALQPLSLATGGPLIATPQVELALPAGNTTVVPRSAQLTAASTDQRSGDRWRPLLLLLVPAVPFFVLTLQRRLAEADVDPEVLAERFPGLATLKG